ncbi:MAG: hypothetical protein KJO01_11360 [Gammaproteobacteria bacterium]|nr:hypothetical protein [Gammaproteobacteria bacterium]
MKRFIVLLTVFSFVLPFSACGQSGSLYLPDDPSRIENLVPLITDGEEDEEKEKTEAPPE